MPTLVATGQFTLNDLLDGISIVLSNNAHLAPARSDGSNPDLTGATSTASVRLGSSDVSAAWTFVATPSTGVTGAQTDQTYVITGMTVDVGFVDFVATKPGETTLTARFNIAKVRQGNSGEGNQQFDDGFVGYYSVTGVTPTYLATLANRSGVFSLASGATGQWRSTKQYTVDTSRKYKISFEYYVGAGTGSSQLYVGFVAFDVNGVELAHNPGGYAYAASVGDTFASGSGWTARNSLQNGGAAPITGEGTGAWTIFPVGTKTIQLLVLQNYNNAALQTALNYLTLEDITESQAALIQANAAATQSSIATTQAGLAGVSATAANTSATNANVSEGNASSSAGTATTQASNAASSAASASSSASISAAVSVASISKNPRFTDYASTGGLPVDWENWSSGGNGVRVTNPSGGYAYRLALPAATIGGIVNYSPLASVKLNDYLVFEAEVTLVAGSLVGSGIHTQIYDDGLTTGFQQVNINFSNEIPVGMTAAPGNGVVGETYRYSKLVQVSNVSSTRPLMYALTAWDGFIALASIPAKTLDWRRCGYRAATAAEIAAGVAFPALQASVTTTQTTVATLSEQNALARYEVVANTGGGTARLRLISTTYGTNVLLDADKIFFGDNTVFDNTVDALITTNGTISRITALGATFGTDGSLTTWEGLASVIWGDHSRANAHHYTAASPPYAGGSRRLVRTELIENEAISKEWRFDNSTIISHAPNGPMTSRFNIADLIVTASGKKIAVNALYLLNATHGQDSWALFIVVERTSSSGTIDVYTARRQCAAISGDGHIRDWQTISFTDTPPAGSVTYTLRMYHTYVIGGPGNFFTYDISNRTITAREHKTES